LDEISLLVQKLPRSDSEDFFRSPLTDEFTFGGVIDLAAVFTRHRPLTLLRYGTSTFFNLTERRDFTGNQILRIRM